jgi:hypothetical protein
LPREFGLPCDWHREFQSSYGMIFGFSGTGRSIFKGERRKCETNLPTVLFDQTLEEHSVGANATISESWEQRVYPYHWKRIQILNNYLQEKRKRRSLWLLLRDKTDTYGYWTIW